MQEIAMLSHVPAYFRASHFLCLRLITPVRSPSSSSSCVDVSSRAFGTACQQKGRRRDLLAHSRTWLSRRQDFRQRIVTGKSNLVQRAKDVPDFRLCVHQIAASEGNNNGWGSQIGEVAQRDSQQRILQVVLVSPQIPGNTGCIARTCAATCVGLHLVEPLGFKIDDSKLKRAGLDYWPFVVVKVHNSWNEFFSYFQEQEGEKRLLAFTKKGKEVHTDVEYKAGDWLLFGSEVDGLPPAALEQCSTGQYSGGTIRLPMSETYVRSLNLSVSAGIGVYEALRQLDAHNNYSSLDVNQCTDQAMVMSGYNDGFP